MFLASDVINHHFGAHTESQESYSLPVAKHFLHFCLAKIRIMFALKIIGTITVLLEIIISICLHIVKFVFIYIFIYSLRK